MNAQAKSFLSSKVLWVNLLAILALALSTFFDVDLGAGWEAPVLAVVNMILRLVTKQPVGWSDDPDKADPADGAPTASAGALVAVVLGASLLSGCAGLKVCDEAAIVLRDVDTSSKTTVAVTCDGATLVELQTAALFNETSEPAEVSK
jgi:hypothetical protein